MARASSSAFQQDLHPQSASEIGRDLSDQDLLARFLSHRDEAAFTTLLHRHSGTVWGVCRRMLSQQQDAEDAFQAVFFLLARKADSIRKTESVGSWLYGVAYRVAAKARQTATRRHVREKNASSATPEPQPSSEASFRELQRLLDEEVQRLAEKYRAPFVLCCLEGLSKAEAAKELGWKEGTLSWRLGQARALLQKRLGQRGVTLSAVLTLLALTPQKGVVSAALLQATSQGVLASLANNAAALSPAVIALANSMMHSMAVAKAKAYAALVLALTVLTGAVGLAAYYWKPARKPVPAPGPTPIRFVQNEPEPPAPRRRPGALPNEAQLVAFAFSPDGKRVVVTGAKFDEFAQAPGQLKLVDLATSKELFALRPNTGVRTALFSPDGQTLASGDFSGSIQLRDPQTGQERVTVTGHKIGVNGLAYSPDGKWLVSAGLDGVVKLWDANDLHEQKLLLGHGKGILSVKFFRDGRTIVTGSADHTAKIWDLDSGTAKRTLQGHEEAVETVAVSPSNDLVATGSWDKTVRLWNAATGEEIAVLPHEGAVLAVAFSHDGQWLASAGIGGKIYFWDVKSYQLVKSLKKHRQDIWSLAFSPDGEVLASGSSLGLVRLTGALPEAADVTIPPGKSYQEYAQSFKGNKDLPPG